jgi:hypothetical protein
VPTVLGGTVQSNCMGLAIARSVGSDRIRFRCGRFDQNEVIESSLSKAHAFDSSSDTAHSLNPRDGPCLATFSSADAST